jgi:UDP-N-acetylglucosamine/UDP-N-acetylgalactosamine diphosphorylase
MIANDVFFLFTKILYIMLKNNLFEQLQPFGQEHLLTFWDSLSQAEQADLALQIKMIDFAQLAQLYEHRNDPAESLTLAGQASDPPAYKFSTVTDPTPCQPRQSVTVQEAIETGREKLQKGLVGAILVAGGQGTRLGFPHPKGMYPIAPVSDVTLFQIHFEKVLAASRRYGYHIPYCVMTSPATHRETVQFLEQQHYFGLSKEDVFIFCQGTMPAVSLETGNVLLDSKGGIALSPDGHGGMLAAITRKENGISVLDRLRQRGIEYLFYNQVDNPLVRICSPEFLGYHILSGSELTCQVIRKKFPMEKVGNIVEVAGRLYVIEYSDLPEHIAKQTNSDGSLKIWAGSIAVHAFNVPFLDRTSQIASALPFHTARKKVPFVDLKSGERMKPEKENAIKFERFIFDLLPSASNAVVVEVDPPNHYAPLKNAPGSPTDSPETVKRDISRMYTDWLKQAGAVVDEGAAVEISPLFADSPEMVAEKVEKGKRFNLSTYLVGNSN